jgi:integrase
MPEELFHGATSRKRIAPNVYRRQTKSGAIVFEAVFRDVDGRQRFRKLEARSEKAAVREARSLLAQRDGGDRVVSIDATLRVFVEAEFLPLIDSLAAAGRRSEQGVRLDRDVWRLYVEPALGDRRLGDVSGANVAAMIRGLRERGLSESTCRNTLSTLGSIYRLARSRKLVTRSPLDELDPGERPRPRHDASNGRRLDERELDALVRHAPEPDVCSVGVAILAYTGVRVSEALALTWERLDFVDREILVAGQLTRAKRGQPARIVPRKGGAPPYPALMFPELERVLTERLRRELAAGRGRDADFVLATRTGRPLNQRTLSRAVEDAATSAGLGHVTPHTLRHSFASLAARRGVDPVQAAKMTGHSLDVWTRYYAGDYGKPQRDEARARMLEHGFGAMSESETDGNADLSR